MKNNILKLRNNFIKDAYKLSKNPNGDCLNSILSKLNYAYSFDNNTLFPNVAYSIVDTYLNFYFNKLTQSNPNFKYEKFKSKDLLKCQIFSINSLKSALEKKIVELNKV